MSGSSSCCSRCSCVRSDASTLLCGSEQDGKALLASSESDAHSGRILWGYFVSPPAIAKAREGCITLSNAELHAELLQGGWRHASLAVSWMARSDTSKRAVDIVAEWDRGAGDISQVKLTVECGEARDRSSDIDKYRDWHWTDSLLSVWQLYDHVVDVSNTFNKLSGYHHGFRVTAQVNQLAQPSQGDGTVDVSIVVSVEGPVVPEGGGALRIAGPPQKQKRAKHAIAELRGDWENFPSDETVLVSCAEAVRAKLPSRSSFSILSIYEAIEPSTCGAFEDSPADVFAQGTSPLARLPRLCIATVAGFLSPRSICQLRSTSKVFWSNKALAGFVPGCRLQLRPHQQRNLSWMRLREAYAREPLSEDTLLGGWSEHSKRYSEHTRWSRLQGACLQCRKPRDKAYAFDALQGVVAFPNQFASPRRVSGGLLCDEPGLGKTVTIVSLCLREMGALPRDSAWTRDDEKVSTPQGWSGV